MSLAAVTETLRKTLPGDALITEAEGRQVYECDGLSAYRHSPGLVVLPRNITEVQQVVRAASAAKVPVVPRGAGTGLSGGALPHTEGVLISLARMNRIISIDSANRRARVQAGVSNLAISEAASEFNLFYAPDPSSQVVCTIGGNVAENAGGAHCLKYGLTVHNVLALKVVGSDGEVFDLNVDADGYDLTALLIGSEGMFGIVAEVTVKLLPKPAAAKLLMASFDSVKAAGQSISTLMSSGITPAAIEMMDNMALRAAEDFANAGYPKDAAALVLCELDGSVSEVDAELCEVEAMLDGRARALVVADDESERARMWSGRKNAFPAIGRLAPDYYCIDGTIPRRQLAEVLADISALSEEFGLPVANVFHAGDGNLHPLILYDISVSGALERTEKFGAAILRCCIEAGGTITGEHGVGIEKLGEMCVQFSDAELAQFHRVRAAFDAAGLLNPGKAIPSLARCAEHNAMHVHDGRLPFPDLPRF